MCTLSTVIINVLFFSASEVLFFYLTKSLKADKSSTEKITRTNKTSNLSPSSFKSSTTSKTKKPTHAIKSSSTAGSISIASSNAKV